MPRNDMYASSGQVTVNHMQIRAADAACPDLDENLSRFR
jgi:hypothetical protein